MKFSLPPTDRIDAHPAVVADLLQALCELEPGEYAVSDESYLSDMVDLATDLAALYAAVRARYGIEVAHEPEPYLWEVVDRIVTRV
jgi:hypothetical protein